ncbi:hypothetical protein HA402_007011 [Bradysia odoriphaga]|nr:hypothetical protein HA402_007011 [Bradysia odoriphaga]
MHTSAQARHRQEQHMGNVIGSTVSGRVIVITGGGTGIGAAIAERYAAEGAHVVRRRAPGWSRWRRSLRRSGRRPSSRTPRTPHPRRPPLLNVLATFGRIDVLVANAGGHGFSPVAETDDASWEAAIRANLTTAFTMARESLPALIEAEGADRDRLLARRALRRAFGGRVHGRQACADRSDAHARAGLRPARRARQRGVSWVGADPDGRRGDGRVRLARRTLLSRGGVRDGHRRRAAAAPLRDRPRSPRSCASSGRASRRTSPVR